MTPTGRPHAALPATLGGLQAAIAQGRLSPADALARQRAALAKDRWHCITHIFAAPTDTPGALPLAGVGLAHKDIFVIGDRQPHCGTAHAVPMTDTHTPAITRLEAAGATTLAALTMAEFACGATGENPHVERPVNPLDAAAAVGGSSSGSAVAVAAGLCYGALGTDTAGSVRIPAATCGVFGFKPGSGVIPTAGTHPLSPTLDTLGLLTRSVQDARILFDVLCPVHPAPAQTAAASWRVALALEHPRIGLPAPAITAALRTFARALNDTPAREIIPRELPELTRLADIILHVEAAGVHAQALRTGQPSLGALTRAIAVPGSTLPGPWYYRALGEQARWREHVVREWLGDCDILLTPMLPDSVPDWDAVDTRSPTFAPKALLGLFAWTGFVNYLGLPAASLPIGTDAVGRPISAQILVRPGDEHLLLAFAAQAERLRHGDAGLVPHPPALAASLSA